MNVQRDIFSDDSLGKQNTNTVRNEIPLRGLKIRYLNFIGKKIS